MVHTPPSPADSPAGARAPLGLTDAEIEALPATLDIVTAGRLFGIGKNKARDLANRGEFPCETFKVGKRHAVAKHAALVRLGLRAAPIAA
jgi:hypothetical protein